MPNIIIKKLESEHATKILRRFSRSVKNMGIVPHIRSTTYHQRQKSQTVKRSEKISKLKKYEKKQKLYRLGKIITPIFHTPGQK